ncbi:MAG: 4-hydroxybutyrate CoA-transferase, partial [Myxococcales bacterium]|nr:4-hydroxybutyrate CoA-transferase [Polyangiaceae bacterium]MDW8251708.1 4-hydroxybutyrate CoA-transferase [Myxococcales bacterium]
MLDPSWRSRACSADEVMASVQSGARVFVHGAAATPTPLLEALARNTRLEGVRIYHLHTAGPYPFSEPGMEARVRSVSFFTGPGARSLINEGRGDFIPVFLSDIPGLFRKKRIPLDVAVVQLSPPDRHGICSLGTSVDAARAAVDTAKIVLAEINEQMPRTHGASSVPLERIHAFTLTNRPLHEAEPTEIGEVEDKIGELIAPLIEDGATLQIGIGAIP